MNKKQLAFARVILMAVYPPSRRRPRGVSPKDECEQVALRRMSQDNAEG